MATGLEAAHRDQHRNIKSMATSEENKCWYKPFGNRAVQVVQEHEGKLEDTLTQLKEVGGKLDTGLIKKVDVLFQRVCLNSSRRWPRGLELTLLNGRRT
jgi:hypothetical protein